MIYLDTGCLVKLYYPEPDSSLVAAKVAGRRIVFNSLHELEITNALRLNVAEWQISCPQTPGNAR